MTGITSPPKDSKRVSRSGQGSHICTEARLKINSILESNDWKGDEWQRCTHLYLDEIRHCIQCRGYARGRVAEVKFLKAFATRRTEKPRWPSWFLSVRQATPEEDQRGVDAFVQTDVRDFPVQIKSAKRHREAIMYYRRRSIIVLIIENKTTLRALLEKTYYLIKLERERFSKRREELSS